MKKLLEIGLAVCFAWNVMAVSAEPGPAKFGEFKTTSINGAVGNLNRTNGTFRLSNSATNDSGIYFVFQPFSGNGQVTARVRRPVQSLTKSGILFRQTTNAISPSAGMFLTGSNTVFERLLNTNELPVLTVRTNESVEWLRIVREGTAFSGFLSKDGTNWIQISADTIEMPEKTFAGFAVFGKGETLFDEVRMLSAHLASPTNNSNFSLPTNIVIRADVVSLGNDPSRVDFFAGAETIGEAMHFPYAMVWSNALAGSHSLTAKITGDLGAAFFTEPMVCEPYLLAAKAKFLGVDPLTRGDWKGKYGAEGFQIVCHSTNYPSYAEVSATGYKNFLMGYSSDPGALQLTNGTGRIISHQFTYTNMTINVSFLDGRAHQVALYCQDAGSNVRVQTIEVLDGQSRIVLDARRMADFSAGKYLVWDIRGRVKFRTTRVAGGPSVVSGVFFDASEKSETAR
ncbi:MAG: Ig-like domain-containing protein [Verrucomicrobiota bacterium]